MLTRRVYLEQLRRDYSININPIILIIQKEFLPYKGVEIWCLTLYLFHRLGKLTLIVPCYFGHSSVNLGYKITL